MSYQSDLHDALVSDGGVSAIVGSRVWSDVADGTDATPYLVYQVISATGTTTHDGSRNIDELLIQVSAWANGRSAAIALAKEVTDMLDGQTQSGSSGLTLVFGDQQSRHDTDTNLFGEIMEFRGNANRN